MDTKTNALREPATGEVSFIRGGPFYRVQLALRLIGPNQWNFTRRILILIAIGWLPLLMITALLNPEGLSSFIREYRAHARLLIAVPALIIGEGFMESRFRLVVRHIRQVGILDTPDLAYMDGVLGGCYAVAWTRLRCRLPANRCRLVCRTRECAPVSVLTGPQSLEMAPVDLFCVQVV